MIKHKIKDFPTANGNIGFWVYALKPLNIEISTGDVNVVKNGYIGKNIGRMWDASWEKTVQYYNGDAKYKNGITQLDDKKGFIYLQADKIPNISSRAQVKTIIGSLVVRARVNLINVGDNGNFELWASKKDINTTYQLPNLDSDKNLTLFAAIKIYKHKITCSVNILDDNYNVQNIYRQLENYNQDFNQLTNNGSDVEIEINWKKDDGTIEFKVTNLANDKILYDENCNIDTFITQDSIDNFQYAGMRVEINDDNSSTGSMEEGKNVSVSINNFSTDIQKPNIVDVNDFLKQIDFSPIYFDAKNKTIVENYTDNNKSIHNVIYIYDNNTLSYNKFNDGNQIIGRGKAVWRNGDNNVLTVEKNKEYSLMGVKHKENNTIEAAVYNNLENKIENRKYIYLDDVLEYKEVTEYDVKNLFSNTEFSDYLPKDLNGTWETLDGNYTLTFDNENKTVRDCRGLLGKFYIQDGMVIIKYPNSAVYLIPYLTKNAEIKGYAVETEKTRNRLVNAWEFTLIKK
jgi:hypothetical protein